MGRQLLTLLLETLKYNLRVTIVAANDVSAVAQSGKSPNSKEASPVKVAESEAVDPKQEAANCLAVGKRNLLVSDIPLAVSSLGEACELFTKVYGETAPECAETYFYYGKALLEMARLESGVLGNALDGGEEDDSQEETENEEGEEKDGVADGEKEKNGEAGGETTMETESKSEGETVEGGEKEGEDKNEQEAEDEEDPSNLQLAWEMLELAKVVYTKTIETNKDTEVERRLCETYMVLGEVSLENENYPQAVEDLTICLKRRTDSLPADSRCIAETQYQLGIAQGFDMKWEEAVVSLEAAIKVLEKRIENLKAKTESPDETKKDDSSHTREKEVTELEALIPEIKEKITDTNEMKAESIRKMKEAVGFTSGSGPSDASSSASSSKPISSIAIKRKGDDQESEAKKPKEDSSVTENGDSKPETTA